MRCYDPILVYQMDKRKIYRNWSVAQKSVYLRCRTPDMVFNCDKCLFCRKRRSLELAARCVLHASLYEDNMFLTLTYNEQKEGYHNDMDYTEIQKFKKRLRAHVGRKASRRIEVFNVHEYGKNGKKHWHLIVFNYDFPDRTLYTTSNGMPLFTSKALSQLWPYGFHTIGGVSEASALYQAQYMEKDIKNGNITNGKKSNSKHSGLAKPYFMRHYDQILRLGYVPFSGRKLGVPRYFQKLAHKHWCHFNEPSAFFDSPLRKAKHRPFKLGEENKDIADLYGQYILTKQERIVELSKEFAEVIVSYLDKEIVPDFVGSGSNALYDLKNKTNQERF